jgi:hypothetical protein
MGEASHMPQAKLFSKEEWQEDFPNPTTNSEAQGEKEHVKQSIQQRQEIFPPLQVEWTLGSKVLVTSSRASPQKPHNQEKSVESED